MTSRNIDIMDEALRILYLEGISEEMPENALAYILSEEVTVEMTAEQQDKLFHGLSALQEVQSIGQLIRHKLQKDAIAPEQLSANASLPIQVVNDLLNDKIYTNNIPVMLFRKVLNLLNISFSMAEKAIRKTFDMLQNNIATTSSSPLLYPALRKSNSTARQETQFSSIQSGAKELYENKEALAKYINRLQELMNQ